MLLRTIPISLVLALSLWGSGARAAEVNLAPPPQDWREQSVLFGRIASMPTAEDEKVVAWVWEYQQTLSSGYLFEAARRQLGRNPEQALELYALGLIRGDYDARRCVDTSARRAISRLSRQAEVVGRYGHGYPVLFGKAGLKAMARPDLLGHTVSAEWACAQALSGMGAHSAGLLPAEKWPAVEEKVLTEYREQFEAMAKR